MKRRKTFIGMIMLIAVLVLGVGYAAVTGVKLTINGKANAVANADFKVIFDTANHTPVLNPEATDTITWGEPQKTTQRVEAAYESDLTANMTVVLDSDKRSGSATFRVKNNSEELGATIQAAVTQVAGDYADYFEVTKAYGEYKGVTFAEGTTTLEAGDTVDVTVTVTLKKLPVLDITDQVFTVQLNADPVAATAKN